MCTNKKSPNPNQLSQVVRSSIPAETQEIMSRLEAHGYKAYLVGGCVRDMLLGREPSDYDITTSALPDETQAVFADCATLEIGKAHGTIGIIMNHDIYEVTTYRVDGEYTDSRHPDQVRFTRSIEEDLKRRDFTINAIAMDLRGEMVGTTGFREDLWNRQIRTVGDPSQRFREDALRIMRGTRFASQLGFNIEEKTAEAIHRDRELLKGIAVERIQTELNKLLLGPAAEPILREYRDVLAVFMPEIETTFDFDQKNPYHCYNIYEHCIHAVSHAPKTVVLRLAALLHDIGKPACFQLKEGWGHFYGHEQTSAEMAHQILKRLKYDRKTISQVTELIDCHGYIFNQTEKYARRRLHQLGEEQLLNLIALERADVLSQAEFVREERAKNLDAFRELVEAVIAKEIVLCRKDLKLNGRDLLQMGIPQGPEIGCIMQIIFDRVIDGELPNDRDVLIDAAREAIKSSSKGDDWQ